MTDPRQAHPETLEEFKNSFSYGSRSDLLFKFLKSLPPDEAGEFLKDLLAEVGTAVDHGSVSGLADLVYEWQVKGYAPRPDKPAMWSYDEGFFAPMRHPVKESRIGLLTSSGHFVAGDDPKPFGVENMTQEEAERRIDEFLKTPPQLSVIPRDTPNDSLRVRHGGYDVRPTVADPNVSFPLEVLRDLEAEGAIAEFGPHAYSFVGATAQRRLLKESAPAWADRIAADELDAVLLVPV